MAAISNRVAGTEATVTNGVTTGNFYWYPVYYSDELPSCYRLPPPEPDQKLLGKLRCAEANRKAASDFRSRERRRPKVPTHVLGRRLQTFDAAMAARQAVRYGP